MRFCQKKIDHLNRFGNRVADKESQILMWDLMILLLRRKNQPDGSDISELLCSFDKQPQQSDVCKKTAAIVCQKGIKVQQYHFHVVDFSDVKVKSSGSKSKFGILYPPLCSRIYSNGQFCSDKT